MVEPDETWVEFKLELTEDASRELLETLRESQDSGVTKKVRFKIDPDMAVYGINQLEEQLE